MLMNLKSRNLNLNLNFKSNRNRILSRNKRYRKKDKKLKAFQNIVAIFKINSIDFRFFLFLHVGLLGFVVITY